MTINLKKKVSSQLFKEIHYVGHLLLTHAFPCPVLAGVPGVVDFVSVETMSSSSLSVQWLCPEAVGTHDPILLNYQLTYYSSASSSVQSVINVKTSVGMQDKNSCLLRAVLEGLEEGTSYSVQVRAMTGDVMGEESGIVGQATTFGQGGS